MFAVISLFHCFKHEVARSIDFKGTVSDQTFHLGHSFNHPLHSLSWAFASNKVCANHLLDVSSYYLGSRTKGF